MIQGLFGDFGFSDDKSVLRSSWSVKIHYHMAYLYCISLAMCGCECQYGNHSWWTPASSLLGGCKVKRFSQSQIHVSFISISIQPNGLLVLYFCVYITLLHVSLFGYRTDPFPFSASCFAKKTLWLSHSTNREFILLLGLCGALPMWKRLKVLAFQHSFSMLSHPFVCLLPFLY